MRGEKQKSQHASHGFLRVVVQADVAEEQKHRPDDFPDAFVSTEEMDGFMFFEQYGEERAQDKEANGHVENNVKPRKTPSGPVVFWQTSVRMAAASHAKEEQRQVMNQKGRLGQTGCDIIGERRFKCAPTEKMKMAEL